MDKMENNWKWLLIGTIVSWTVGMLGADRVYRGQVGLGVLKLITCGGFGIWYIVDALIWTKKLGEASTK